MSFVLSYPKTGSTTETVTLRSPEFANTRKVEMNAIIARSDFGDAMTRAVSGRSVWTMFDYRFIVFDDETLLRDFLEATTGLEIKVTDHNSVERTGFIITNPIQFVELRDNMVWEVSFTFMESQ